MAETFRAKGVETDIVQVGNKDVRGCLTMKLPQKIPLAYDSMTKEQFDSEIEKGMEDIRGGRVYAADNVEAQMKRDYGI